jgi:FkbM family methyltransferase
VRIRLVKERFKRLQKGPLRGLVAIVGTIQQSIKHLSPILIYLDKEGDWHNCRSDIALISPELSVASWKEIQSAVNDFWCHDYQPQLGDTIVDIGAGIGDDAVAFSRLVGKNGRVIAIEAHPHTYRCLVKTIKANRLDNVIAVNAAVADREGYITISDGENYLSNNIHAGMGTVKVQARTLANILKQTDSSRVDLIKMNIEGAETAALEGMTEILRTLPHVVVSCHDFKADRGESTEFRTYESVYQLLNSSGFQLLGREEDPRPEVRYFLYGEKSTAPEVETTLAAPTLGNSANLREDKCN